MSASTVRLQPWLTIYMVAQYLSKNGYDIHIITDTKECANIDNIRIHIVKSLLSSNSKEIVGVVKSINPKYIVISVTPFSLLFNNWYDKLHNIKKIAFFSYSLYTKKEILNSMKFISLKNQCEFGRELMIPINYSLSRLDEKFDLAICQSQRTCDRIKNFLNTCKIYKIDPGINLDDWIYEKKEMSADTVFMYTGSPKKIRGLYMLLDAFSLMPQEKIHLKILSRGSQSGELKGIEAYIRQKKIEHRVTLIGGWIPRSTLKKELSQADLLVLPFVLVPAELPVTLMESIACGTPVLVTDIDGLPSAVGKAGLVAPHADVSGLSRMMQHYHENPTKKEQLHRACHVRRSQMKSWDEIGNLWQNVLSAELCNTHMKNYFF
jgi:glycosyltransferase involved in cell wall biosynthesis